MRILVSGGSGFIGSALCRALADRGDQVVVLSRSPARVAKALPPAVKVVGSLRGVEPCDAVINLAGENLSGRRWNERFKRQLLDSRLDTTRALLAWAQATDTPPRTWINGSAIGYYGDRGDELIDETSPSGHESEFTVDLCRRWEGLAAEAADLGARLCLLRTGVVLGHGGALKQMLLPFKLGLGGRLSDGQQWMSWIHLDDEVRAIVYLVDHDTLSGPFNLTAPSPVRNVDFTRILGRVLGRPTPFPAPAWALKLGMGEMAELVLGGQRVLPNALQAAGFEFRYPDLEKALQAILD
ncbi:MAG: TIGR01777 family oxidoreductase [Pseudomonadota bacterium]